jgi:outer membrane protein assembly factor BamB
MFIGNKLVNNDKFIIVSSNSKSYVIDSTNGTIISKKNFSSSIKPIINNNLIFFISKNNLILSMDSISGKILYSYSINDQIAEFLKIKKKNNLNIKNFTILNSQLILFLNNSYILKFNITGKLNQVLKLPTKINSQPIVINGTILYLNNKNKLVKFD